MPSGAFGNFSERIASPATSSSASSPSIIILWTSSVCRHRLIVEADGGQHSNEVDARRRCLPESQGFRILRFWNNDILNNEEGVTGASSML